MFILEFGKTIAHDKQLHFIAGIVCGFAAYFNLFFGLLFLQAVALGKEYYDYKMPNHTTDFNDYTATIAGGLVTVMILALLKVIQ